MRSDLIQFPNVFRKQLFEKKKWISLLVHINHKIILGYQSTTTASTVGILCKVSNEVSVSL